MVNTKHKIWLHGYERNAANVKGEYPCALALLQCSYSYEQYQYNASPISSAHHRHLNITSYASSSVRSYLHGVMGTGTSKEYSSKLLFIECSCLMDESADISSSDQRREGRMAEVVCIMMLYGSDDAAYYIRLYL